MRRRYKPRGMPPPATQEILSRSYITRAGIAEIVVIAICSALFVGLLWLLFGGEGALC